MFISVANHSAPKEKQGGKGGRERKREGKREGREKENERHRQTDENCLPQRQAGGGGDRRETGDIGGRKCALMTGLVMEHCITETQS